MTSEPENIILAITVFRVLYYSAPSRSPPDRPNFLPRHKVGEPPGMLLAEQCQMCNPWVSMKSKRTPEIQKPKSLNSQMQSHKKKGP